jgi:hypothetical protein
MKVPLIAHFAPGMSVGRREAGPVDVEQFLGTARALAQRLPPVAYCLNLCEDRLNFALALAAALLRRTVSLLPPTREGRTARPRGDVRAGLLFRRSPSNAKRLHPG